MAFIAVGMTAFVTDAHADGIDNAGVHAHAATGHDVDARDTECPQDSDSGHDSHCSTASGVALIAPAVNATMAERIESPVAYRSPMHAAADIDGPDRPPRRA